VSTNRDLADRPPQWLPEALKYLIMISEASRATPKYAARVAQYAPGSPFGPRQLRDFELVWILSGSATWEYRHPRLPTPARHAVRPGDVLIAPPGGVDSYAWDELRPSSHAYIHFDVPDLDPSDGPRPLVRATGQDDVVWALCRYLLELSDRDEPDVLAATQRALVVLLEAFVGSRSSVPDRRLADGPVAAALSRVRDVWRTDGLQIVPLEELAATAGLTVGHLSRLFSRAFDHGLSASLELVRLGRAAIDLHRSNLTLDEIARYAGFANPYHFSRRFSHAYGMPPGRFRRTADTDALAPLTAAGLMPLWNFLQES
jgi:AraC-like DNA-binding protein